MELNQESDKDGLKNVLANNYEQILKRSQEMDGAMGAIAFAVLEMFRLGGLKTESINEIHKDMDNYFMNPTNEQCNDICRMVEARLKSDKRSDHGLWYK